MIIIIIKKKYSKTANIYVILTVCQALGDVLSASNSNLILNKTSLVWKRLLTSP